jgi:hypothetical protein
VIDTPPTNRFIERRVEPRVTLRQSVEVQDAATSEPLGRLLNLSRTGFMLLSPVHVTPGRELRLALRLPGEQPVELHATCMWCQRSSYSETFGAGFSLQSPSPAAARLIAKLLDAPD